jgi:hypothetical protein
VSQIVDVTGCSGSLQRPRSLSRTPPGQYRKRSGIDHLGRTPAFLSQGVAMRRALDLFSLVSADDALEHHPFCLINKAIVDRVVSCEHSINKRPIERVDKDFWIEIGLKLALINPAL